MAGMERTLGRTGQKLQGVGRDLTVGLTAPIVGIAGAAMKAAIDFESAFSGVSKTVDGVARADGKLTEFGKHLSQEFRELAKVIPVSVNELAKIGETAGAMGIPKEVILDFTAVMAKLGATTNLTSEQAAASIGKIQNVYQAAGVDTDRFAASLVALGNAGASTESQILEFAERMAGAAVQSGITQAEILGWANAMASVGLNAELGSTAWNKVSSAIGKAVDLGSEDLALFAQAANMSTEAFSNLFRADASEAMNRVVEGLGRVKESGGNLTATMQDMGFKTSGIQMTFKNLAASGDMVRHSLDMGKQAWIDNVALQEEFNKKAATTKAMLQVLYNNLYDVAITAGKTLVESLMRLKPAIEGVVKGIADTVKWFSELPRWVQDAAFGFAGFLAAIGPIAFAMGSILSAGGRMIGLFRDIIKWAGLSQASSVASTMASSTAATASGATAARAALGWRAFWLAQAGPIGLAAAGAYGIASILDANTSDATKKQIVADTSKNHGYTPWANPLQDQKDEAALLAEMSGTLPGAPGAFAGGFGGTSPEMAAKMMASGGGAINDFAEAAEKGKEKISEFERSVRSMIGTLSGSNLVNTAKEWDEALTRIGGDARLTAKEWDQYSEAIADAVEKMRLMGQEIPRFWAIIASTRVNDKMLKEQRDYIGQSFGSGFEMNRQELLLPSSSGNLAGLMNAVPGGIKSQGASGPVYEWARSIGQVVKGGFRSAVADMPQVIMSALTGGGNVGQSVGGLLGGNIIGGFAGKIAGGLSGMLGSTIGGAIGSIIPGVGTMIGSMIGPLVGNLIGKIGGGPSKKELEGRDVVSQFEQQIAGALTASQRMEAGGEKWKMTVIGVRDAYLATGRSAADAERDVKHLWDSSRDGAEAAKLAAEGINEAFREQQADIERLDAAISKYGFTLEELGKSTQLKMLNDQAFELAEDWRVLVGSGIDLALVNERMAGAMNEYVLAAIRTGTEVPFALKPILESMAEQGRLFDSNGLAITDLEASGITYAETMTQGFDRVVVKLQLLIDTLNGTGKAIENLPTSKTIDITTRHHADGGPTYFGQTLPDSSSDTSGFTGSATSGPSVTVNAGTVIGNPDELAVMVADSIEGGGSSWGRWSTLNRQLAPG